jgi:hypothetical protein
MPTSILGYLRYKGNTTSSGHTPYAVAILALRSHLHVAVVVARANGGVAALAAAQEYLNMHHLQQMRTDDDE